MDRDSRSNKRKSNQEFYSKLILAESKYELAESKYEDLKVLNDELRLENEELTHKQREEERNAILLESEELERAAVASRIEMKEENIRLKHKQTSYMQAHREEKVNNANENKIKDEMHDRELMKIKNDDRMAKIKIGVAILKNKNPKATIDSSNYHGVKFASETSEVAPNTLKYNFKKSLIEEKNLAYDENNDEEVEDLPPILNNNGL